MNTQTVGMTMDGSTPVFDEPMRQAIRSVTNMMRLDYGQLFNWQFPKNAKGGFKGLNAWQHRLLSLLGGHEPADLLDAYDALLVSNRDDLPKISELCAMTERVRRARFKAENERAEAERIGAMPPPEISETVAQQNLAKMRALLATAGENMSKKETPEEEAARHKRLDEKLAVHERLLAEAFPRYGKPQFVSEEHQCAVPFCTNFGGVSSSISGGKFYCRFHAIKRV